jgi:hypothetical protein
MNIVKKNILPAVYSGMNKVVQKSGENISSAGGVGGIPPGGVGGIPQRDKMLLNLQAEAEQKKKQIKEDYRDLKSQIKENPHLQEALIHYEEYFALQEKQIKALKNLLNDSFLKKEDHQQIKREIANLEKNLA